MPAPSSLYDLAILNDGPVHYMVPETGGWSSAAVGYTTVPNGDSAWLFPSSGQTYYVTYPSVATMSVPTTGVLTIESWVRPDVLVFLHEDGTGHATWLGKGTTNKQEYVCRMYGQDNTEGRQNRVQGECFNPIGGAGIGSFFQETVTPGEWIHVALVINTVSTSPAYPTGYTKIFKNGVFRDQDSLNDLSIVPVANDAPFRIGTRDFGSFFEGGVGKVALYNYELTAAQLLAHYNLMTSD